MLMIRYTSNAMRKKRNILYNRYASYYDKLNTIPPLYKNIAPAGMPPKVYHPAGSECSKYRYSIQNMAKITSFYLYSNVKYMI